MITTPKIKNHVIEALEQKRFFKLVCGASLTDVKMVENLSFVFTLAGAHVIDLAPTSDVILAARKGIERALCTCPSSLAPVLMASIQLDKDPHFRKVVVAHDLCDVCGACVKVCPTEAFRIERDGEFVYLSERCFGCGICPSYCHVDALSMIETKPSPKETLKEMLLLGVKAIEFHFGENYRAIEDVWPDIKDLLVGAYSSKPLLSFSIGSDLLSDKEIKFAANLCYKLAGKNIILQCDGKPMSGGLKNGNNKSNSYLRVAKIIQKEKLPVYLQISGGTDEESFARTVSRGLDINGVAIGSYARKLLMPYLKSKENLNDAIKIAKSLVDSVK